MPALCITGLHQAFLDQLCARLVERGLRYAQPISGHSISNIPAWEASVLRRVENFTPRQGNPGRLWEQLAIDLFLANVEYDVWGWASVDSLRLIEFWSKLEDSIYFLLICEPAVATLKRAILSGDDSRVERDLEQWVTTHEAMLRFHLREPRRSLLINSTKTISLNKVEDYLSVASRTVDWVGRLNLYPNHHIDKLLRGDPSAVVKGGDMEWAPENHLLDHLCLRVLAEHPRASELQDELIASFPVDDSQSRSTECVSETNDKDTHASLLVKDYVRFSVSVLGSERKARAQAEEALRGEQALKVKTIAELDESRRARDAMTKARDDMSKAKDEATKARDVALAELDRERKARGQVVADLQSELRASESKLSDLVLKARESEERRKEAAEESELLLGQLHMVQEELERYFIQYQELQSRLSQLENSMARVMTQATGAFDCDSLVMNRVDGFDESELVIAKAVRGPGVYREKFEFNLHVAEGKISSIVLNKLAMDSAGFRWPIAVNDEKLTITASLSPETAKTQYSALSQLSSSDWDILTGMLRTMVMLIAQGKLQKSDRHFNAIRELFEWSQEFPHVVRFDSARITGQQSSASREVLALEFKTLGFGNRRVQKLNFQLQATPQPDGTLGLPSYLIFPRDCATQPFEVWMASANDAASNAVMAIPFEPNFRHRILWDRLSSGDRRFVKGLCEVLPYCFLMLSKQSDKATRSWTSWTELVQQMNQWLTVHPFDEVEASKPDEAAQASLASESLQTSESSTVEPGRINVLSVPAPSDNDSSIPNDLLSDTVVEDNASSPLPAGRKRGRVSASGNKAAKKSRNASPNVLLEAFQ